MSENKKKIILVVLFILATTGFGLSTMVSWENFRSAHFSTQAVVLLITLLMEFATLAFIFVPLMIIDSIKLLEEDGKRAGYGGWIFFLLGWTIPGIFGKFFIGAGIFLFLLIPFLIWENKKSKKSCV